jgi:hypothetical protein
VRQRGLQHAAVASEAGAFQEPPRSAAQYPVRQSGLQHAAAASESEAEAEAGASQGLR